LARRIFEIAKDLGVDSKAIVKKCHDEGIPESMVKNHMSSISAGLEATIKEWFTQHETAGGTATAVETSEKVDLDKVRTKAPRKRKAGPKDESPVVTPPAEVAPPSVPVEEAPVAAPAPEEPKPRTKKVTAPTIVAPPPALEPTIVTHEPPAPPAPETPVHVEIPVPEPVRPAPVEVAAKAPEGPSDSAPVIEPPKTIEPHTRPKPAPKIQPAPMNVPVRPTSVAPAGPKLETRAPVKLSGPKVVRVEAPEVIQAPRPRRVGPPTGPGPGGPRTGGGAGPGTMTGDDDRGRSPRRKQEGGAGSAAAKRSSGVGVPDRRRGRSGGDWVGSTTGVFSEQDLIEREARLLRAGGFLKKRKQELKKPGQPGVRPDGTAGPAEGKVRISAPFTIKDLSAITGVKASEIIKKLFSQGLMIKINDGLDPIKAQEVMMEFNIDLEVAEARTAEESVSDEFVTKTKVDERARGPVVTILGHVDHGKTSLLDKIRNANVAAGEAGGITQKTSAFTAEVDVAGEKRNVVFLDTPGHEAFTAMRSRGAKMTDVVVLVVSAPEGVMPQTIESINHAKAANVPIVVALNKIDRPDATEAMVQKTLGQLAEHGLNPVEWGGTTEVVRTSATTGQGIKELLETLDYQAQLLELKGDFGGAARGTVIEAKVEEGRGATANILMQDGKLKVGDFIVAGRAFGRVRDITDDKGKRVKEAHPPQPVQISGIDEVPDAGDKFYVVDSLKKAMEAAEQRRMRERQTQLAQPKVTLDSLFSTMTETEVKEIKIVLKADLQGTVDVLKAECEKVGTAEVKVRVLHAAIGGITESDVLLADASKAIIIGFNVIPSGKARQVAETKGVEIRTYQVIYDITDDLKKAAEGLLAPDIREEVLGHADVRKVFKITKVGSVAGCYVTDGTVQRDALIRVTRNGVVIEHDRKLEQLKRVKDDVKDVRAGMECGMKIVGYDDIKEGDVLECYKKVEVKRTLGAPETASKR
jgi:translation initiation factor IF-2